MDAKQAKRKANMVVMASWLALFCFFGFRATFAVLKVPMGNEMHWSSHYFVQEVMQYFVLSMNVRG